MFVKMKNFDFNASYQSIRQYTSNTYHYCVAFINSNTNKLTNKLTEITKIGREKAAHSYGMSKEFVFTHKHAIGAAAGVAAVLLAIKFLNKKNTENKDQIAKPNPPVEEEKKEKIVIPKPDESKKIIIPKPSVTLNPSFQVFNARIAIPKIDLPPPNVAITFCIDASGSMVRNDDKENRQEIVKEAIKNILMHADKVLRTSPNSVIGLTIVTFNKTAQTVLPCTVVNPSNNNPILSKIDSIQSDGGTSLTEGLQQSYREITQQKKIDNTQSQILILLTDAETSLEDEHRASNTIQSIAKLGIKFFAIGIGKRHEKEPLLRLSTVGKGTYIDTSSDVNKIVPVVKNIFKSSIAPFQNIKLSNSELPDNRWYLVKNMKTSQQQLSIEITNNKNSPKTYDLGNLAHTKRLDQKILIDTSNVQHAETTFCLTYTDPLGEQGTFTFTIPLTVGTSKLNGNQ